MVTDNCDDFNENAVEDKEAVMAKVQEATQAILKAAAQFGNEDSLEPLNKIIQSMNSVHSTNQFNSRLHCIGSAVRTGGAGRGNGRPRGTAPLCKGRRPAGATTAAAKRPRNLAQNIKNNLANAKPHGSGH
ncbi:hypothetical protein Pmani_012630 [Petrolisthes manimaculis]|uniref:Uncharacterized protein n=1 Tax=Petrolisthes manimaculis TaxID=1843537 RepID=A0AAE1PY17_9EUCA|nr:hypothetical protein Pmani_012630 [Petrolisthes manimaculis]